MHRKQSCRGFDASQIVPRRLCLLLIKIISVMITFYFLFSFQKAPVKPQIEIPDPAKNIPVGDGSPVTTTVGNNVTILTNTTITIMCPHSGVPTPTVTWGRDGRDLADEEGYEFRSDASLVIKGAVTGGVYTCSVKSVAGTDRASSRVTVVGKYLSVSPSLSLSLSLSVSLSLSLSLLPARTFFRYYKGSNLSFRTAKAYNIRPRRNSRH